MQVVPLLFHLRSQMALSTTPSHQGRVITKGGKVLWTNAPASLNFAAGKEGKERQF